MALRRSRPPAADMCDGAAENCRIELEPLWVEANALGAIADPTSVLTVATDARRVALTATRLTQMIEKKRLNV